MRFNSAILLAFGASVVHASTAFAQFSSGQYFIYSQNENATVSRGWAEDRSLNPKRIVANPEPDAWDVTRLSNGRYSLRNRGAPTATIDGNVYAILQGNQHEEWIIERQQLSGLYTIVQSDGQCGWILNNAAANTKVECGIFIVGQSFPPYYPPNTLWGFTPAVVSEN